MAEEAVRRLSGADVAPPIKRGDLNGVDDYDVVVILDGEFGQNMAVTPKEILGLIGRGKTVIGASSMGALRASELDRLGMIGIGWVYNHLRRCAVRRDADVALVYSPLDFQPMTVPMVDIEYWVEQGSAAGLIPGGQELRLLKHARDIFFADRTSDRLIGSLVRSFGDRMIGQLLAFSGGAIPSIKSLDAVEAVRFSTALARRSTN